MSGYFVMSLHKTMHVMHFINALECIDNGRYVGSTVVIKIMKNIEIQIF